LHRLVLRRCRGRAISLALRSSGAGLALLEGAAAESGPRLDPLRLARTDGWGAAHEPGVAAGSHHPRRQRRRPSGGLRDFPGLVPLASTFAALDATRPVLGVLPSEHCGRADRRISDELAGRDLLLEKSRSAV